MKPRDYLALDENIRFRRVGDEGVIVDQRSAEVMVISEVAVRALELIRDTRSMRDVLAGITGEFEVSLDQARVDMEYFIGTLRSRSMLCKEAPNVSP